MPSVYSQRSPGMDHVPMSMYCGMVLLLSTNLNTSYCLVLPQLASRLPPGKGQLHHRPSDGRAAGLDRDGCFRKGSKKWVHRAIRLESGSCLLLFFVSMYVVCYIYSHVNQYLTIYSKYTT